LKFGKRFSFLKAQDYLLTLNIIVNDPLFFSMGANQLQI